MMATQRLGSVVVFLCIVSFAHSTTNCKGTTNNLPIFTDEPTLVKNVTNGKLFVTGSATLDPQIQVVHVYGTPYEMGFAHGLLLKDDINTLFPEFLEYVFGEVESYLHKLPQWLQDIIAKDGVEAALEVTLLLTDSFIPDRFKEEVKGMADALGQKPDDIMRVLLFPELIQAACSMMGSWGEAIANTGGSLYQLRALDWGTASPLQKKPIILVYHPSDGYGHSFATVTWAGFIGAITGISSANVAICEKVWLHYKLKQNRAGMPWMFLLRDILNFDTSVEQALERIHSATRTCSIFVGLGQDTANGTFFNAVEYSYEEVNVFNDNNQPNHTEFTDVVYVDKHTQPSSDPCMPSLIKEYYGNLNAENTLRHITAEFQTGDMHIAVFDFHNQLMYVSNAGIAPVNGSGTPAYDRQFTRLSTASLFAESL